MLVIFLCLSSFNRFKDLFPVIFSQLTISICPQARTFQPGRAGRAERPQHTMPFLCRILTLVPGQPASNIKVMNSDYSFSGRCCPARGHGRRRARPRARAASAGVPQPLRARVGGP